MVAALRVFEHYRFQYRRLWRASVFGTFVVPLLYLAAMGFGVGRLVDARSGAAASLGGVDYLDFLAPGLLAAACLLTAMSLCTYQVLGSFKWDRLYHAMVATPLDARAVVNGHLLWVGLRVLLSAGAYLVAMLIFGAVHSWWALLALPIGVLTGWAFAAPITALSACLETDSGFSLVNRLGIIPVFLFSGTFFPIDQLPAALRWLAYLVPLWHGVAAIRGCTLGQVSVLGLLGHVGALVVWLGAGWALAVWRFRVRLER